MQPQQQRASSGEQGTDLVKPERSQSVPAGYLLVPGVIARLLLPVALVVATHFFLRGHNEPGGGFVAGLMIGIALLMQYLTSGTRWVETHTSVRPARWIALGLLLAAATGLGSLALGYPFLTSHTAHVTVPVLGELHLPSATFFDIAVATVVLGSTLLILTALAHQSIRALRPSSPLSVSPREVR